MIKEYSRTIMVNVLQRILNDLDEYDIADIYNIISKKMDSDISARYNKATKKFEITEPDIKEQIKEKYVRNKTYTPDEFLKQYEIYHDKIHIGDCPCDANPGDPCSVEGFIEYLRKRE